jgi:hypothetical protein
LCMPGSVGGRLGKPGRPTRPRMRPLPQLGRSPRRAISAPSNPCLLVRRTTPARGPGHQRRPQEARLVESEREIHSESIGADVRLAIGVGFRAHTRLHPDAGVVLKRRADGRKGGVAIDPNREQERIVRGKGRAGPTRRRVGVLRHVKGPDHWARARGARRTTADERSAKAERHMGQRRRKSHPRDQHEAVPSRGVNWPESAGHHFGARRKRRPTQSTPSAGLPSRPRPRRSPCFLANAQSAPLSGSSAWDTGPQRVPAASACPLSSPLSRPSVARRGPMVARDRGLFCLRSGGGAGRRPNRFLTASRAAAAAGAETDGGRGVTRGD